MTLMYKQLFGVSNKSNKIAQFWTFHHFQEVNWQVYLLHNQGKSNRLYSPVLVTT